MNQVQDHLDRELLAADVEAASRDGVTITKAVQVGDYVLCRFARRGLQVALVERTGRIVRGRKYRRSSSQWTQPLRLGRKGEHFAVLSEPVARRMMAGRKVGYRGVDLDGLMLGRFLGEAGGSDD